MNTPRLSLVVPVYNVAAYLPQCMESLAALDPAADEIIAIDDGSTDGSARVLEDFFARMPALRVMHQTNSGVSVARNAGIAAARGRYVALVDSDDFLAPDAYRTALQQADKLDLDIAMFNGWYHFEGRENDRLVYPNLAACGPVSGREWIVRGELGRNFMHYPWHNLYRRDFLLASGIKFIPGQKFNEDVPWVTETLLAANRVAYDDTARYYYRKTVRRFSPDVFQRRLEAIVESSVANAMTLDALLRKYPVETSTRQVVAHQLVDGALSIFHKLEQMPERPRASTLLRQLRRDGLFRLLWAHAAMPAHRRRIARSWLRSLL